MSAAAIDMLDRIVVQLQQANGAGVYTNNLSGTGVVQRCEGFTGGPGLAVAVRMDSIELAQGSQRNHDAWRMVVEVKGRVPAAESPMDRENASINLLNDIVRALRTVGRNLNGLAYDVSVTGAAANGNKDGLPGYAVAVVRVLVRWEQPSGV